MTRCGSQHIVGSELSPRTNFAFLDSIWQQLEKFERYFIISGIDNRLHPSTVQNIIHIHKTKVEQYQALSFPEICAFNRLYLCQNLKLTFLECENINSTAFVNKLKFVEVASCGDLGGKLYLLSFDLEHLALFGKIYQYVQHL